MISEVLNSKIYLGGMPPDPPKRVCLHTLCSTVYVALRVPEQLPYSGYATASEGFSDLSPVIVLARGKEASDLACGSW